MDVALFDTHLHCIMTVSIQNNTSSKHNRFIQPTTLNQPYHRNNSNSDHVLTMSPASINVSYLVDTLLDGIAIRMTERIPFIAANGDLCMVFLDLMGFIGNLPSLNSTPDLAGYSCET